MKTRLLILLSSIVLTISISCAQTNHFPGILFNSKNVERLSRTSFLLNDGEPVTIDGNFQISFDISFLTTRYFGHILRIYNDRGTDFRLLFNQFEDRDTFFLQLYENEKLLIDIPAAHNELIRNKWFTLKLKFNIEPGKITLQFADKTDEVHLKLNKDNFYFCFGIRDFSNYHDYDVPRIAVKNIALRSGSELKYLWKLDPASGDGLKDLIRGSRIAGKNIEWLTDSHYEWKEIKETNSPQIPLFAFDSINSRLLIDRKYSLTIYDLANESERMIHYKNPRPGTYDQLIYDPETNRLFSTFFAQGEVSEFNFQTGYWSVIDTSNEDAGHYYGSRRFINGTNLLMFGGYGYYTAKNSLMRYNFGSKDWDRLRLKDTTLTPRFYFSIGEGFHQGEFLIFGGVGNKSGRQEEEFKLYYDLHLLNVDNQSSKLIWDLNKSRIPYVNLIDNLFADKADSSFYFLRLFIDSSTSYLGLVKGSIPARFLITAGKAFKIDSDTLVKSCNLFLSRKTNEFILTTFNIQSKKIKIFNLLYPPIAAPVPENKPASNSRMPLLIIPGVLILVAAGFLLIMYRRKIRPKKANRSDGRRNTHPSAGSTKNFLRVFGGFHLYDPDGNDLSIEFSSKLKELFLLILIYNIRNNNHTGITSDELSSILWPDASTGNSKSNRGVSISKIRNIITKTPYVNLEFIDKSWHLILDEEHLTSDYMEYQKLKEYTEEKKQLEKEEVVEILGLISNGDFLKGISYSWLDAFKVAADEEVIRTLLKLAEIPSLNYDKEILLKIADTVLKIDTVEEKALQLKIKILIRDGKYSLAKNHYELFIDEYKRLYDEEYPESFQKLISE